MLTVRSLSGSSQKQQFCQVCRQLTYDAVCRCGHVLSTCIRHPDKCACNLLQSKCRLQRKLVQKQVAAALASHQDVPTSSSNGSGGGKPRVMVIGEDLASPITMFCCTQRTITALHSQSQQVQPDVLLMSTQQCFSPYGTHCSLLMVLLDRWGWLLWLGHCSAPFSSRLPGVHCGQPGQTAV